MARLPGKPMVIASLLERLTREDPGSTHEAVPLRLHNVEQFRASVARDLEILLNTRRGYRDNLPEQYAEVARSLLLYGLPDFTSKSPKSDADRAEVLQAIEEAIKTFEPRLGDVKVEDMLCRNSSENDDSKNKQPSRTIQNMHFQVTGTLRMDPAPEPVTFDTVFQLSTREYEVKEES